MKKSEAPIIVEEIFSRDVKTVWNAITEADLMHQWFFENIPDFKAVVGFETQFEVTSGEKTFLHLWKIIDVIPLKKITYRWKYHNYSGEANVVFELFEENGMTKLRLTNIVIEDFPDEIPEFLRESCLGGWKYFINERLKRCLEK
jgi:uncharacterized protein YndB with AHSA1/START domain